MADTPRRHVEQPSPAEFRDPLLQTELRRASVWFGLALLIAGVILVAGPLLLIMGALVFAVLLDGGSRLLGRMLPIGRGWRLLLVILAGLGFVGWLLYTAGTTFAAQFEALRTTVEAQATRLLAWAHDRGLVAEGSPDAMAGQLVGSVGRLTSALGSALGVVTSGVLIFVLGIFLATEPKLYDRGLAWMLPVRHRGLFYAILDKVGHNLRRLLFGRLVGMLFEGVFTWAMLSVDGVPFAALLGVLADVRLSLLARLAASARR